MSLRFLRFNTYNLRESLSLYISILGESLVIRVLFAAETQQYLG